ILYLGQQRNKRYEIETAGPAMGKDIEPIIEAETEKEIKAREAKEAEEEKARQEALKKEYDELNERQAKLKKEIEEGEHKLKSYEEAKAIYKKKQEAEAAIEAETVTEDTDLATQPQKDIIYGNVICEECGTRVYGFRCPKCKNTDLHVIDKGFYHSHLMTEDDFKKEMEPTIYPYKLTKAEAIVIYDWWRGNKDKLIIGERTKREAKEKKAKPAKNTKEERMKVAREIVKTGGKLEVRDEDAPFPDETIADEDIPGSSYNNAIPRGKAKGTE
ncbi:MAG: hypothetical protein KAX28_06660, partial [Candidatus Marinimicrobia bacterium]|nr:hypothetical protein [Candidatus Neomarinimicrobiota bacterium]